MGKDWKKQLDKNSEQFWAEMKDKFVAKELQESFEILEKIIGKFNPLSSYLSITTLKFH